MGLGVDPRHSYYASSYVPHNQLYYYAVELFRVRRKKQNAKWNRMWNGTWNGT